MKEWFKTVFTVVGSIIGAGFLSGRELLRFFGEKAYLPNVVLCGVFFFVYLYYLLKIGGKYGGFDGVMRAVFGKFPLLQKVVQGAFLLCSFIVVTAMLAGVNALSQSFAPYISLLTAAGCFFVVKRGLNGVGALNALLVPCMLLYIAVQLFLRGKFNFSFGSERGIMWIWTYVAMNLFLASPVVADHGKELQGKGKTVSAALVSSLIICFFIAVILAAVCSEEGAKGHTMPVFYLLQDGKLFALICYFGMVTTLLSAHYPLHLLSQKLPKGKGAAEVVILLAASLCARLGLEKIVEYAYPLMGGLGVLFLTAVIFYDQFFKQGDQKIHNAGQKTENKRRRHNEV